ncbi:MAG: phenylalanine--tRNA ligase subunit beta, partial [Flavobacteriaceae bacterium]|nr:phenylalanine--tRNA ligase subunit beta [Flavobacteriaceae bacterium]
MKISYNWLKQFLEIEETPKEVANRLTDLGLEVEGIENIGKPTTDLSQVITAKVLECKPHPNADKLKLVYLETGADEALKIVCGAPNVAEDQMVALAPIGSTIINLKGEALTIKKAKIRSEDSFGMICSEHELGISEDASGIMVLSDECPVGIKLSDWIKFETDAIFEIGLTPNRSDAMSHWGVARDLRAAYQVLGKKKSVITPSTSSFKIDNRTNKVKIKVEDKTAVPRYCGITISGIKVHASPLKLQNRLKAIGIAPKNNIVDVTNYIMHELGQPLHAFDVSAIENETIVVRKAKKGEKIITLDEVERNLSEDDIVICDTKKPLCIAGVFGGLNSGVKESTTSVFIESAYFDSVHIRKTSKSHGLSTDASFRYERGIDPNITDYALKRAVLLILEAAGGEVTSDLEDVYPVKIDDKQVFLPFDTIQRLVGQSIDKDTIKSILSALEIKVLNITESGMGLSIPPYRVDVNRPVDVIEEILRVYGYNKIEFNDKLNASTAPYDIYNIHKFQEVIAAQLNAQGCFEIMNNSLSNPEYIQRYLPELRDQKVEIINPLSGDLSTMRIDLLFGGLESIRFNINRKRSNLKLFEFGNTY